MSDAHIKSGCLCLGTMKGIGVQHSATACGNRATQWVSTRGSLGDDFIFSLAYSHSSFAEFNQMVDDAVKALPCHCDPHHDMYSDGLDGRDQHCPHHGDVDPTNVVAAMLQMGYRKP